ncbi:head-tail connector protein [Rickettsia endosymbiont of Cardiosporidium cionae]|uniref:head-tail connector protein n=1 Tax=Rickettsia endosymbiont of Cardiosporidium cionae TaxID=2777155 RepID=UPI001894733E|nr:head-tail connector protein [Rickettsia endosymbiont of Cardiosporidium cionae]KAF8818805.1 hypothetical protein IHI24_000039 [Rickettsia endosymbiont of Cardiosporidium cionae]
MRNYYKPQYEILEYIKSDIWDIKEVKNYLRVSEDNDDSLIERLLCSAIRMAEQATGLTINNKKIRLNVYIDANFLQLKYYPVLELLNITSKRNNSQSINIYDNFGYINDNSEIIFDDKYKFCNIKIKYLAGFTKETLDLPIQQAILMHTSLMYDGQDYNLALSKEIQKIYMKYRKIYI